MIIELYTCSSTECETCKLDTYFLLKHYDKVLIDLYNRLLKTNQFFMILWVGCCCWLSKKCFQNDNLPTTHGGPLHIFITDGLGWSLHALPAGFLVPYQTHCNIRYLTPSVSHSAAHFNINLNIFYFFFIRLIMGGRGRTTFNFYLRPFSHFPSAFTFVIVTFLSLSRFFVLIAKWRINFRTVFISARYISFLHCRIPGKTSWIFA